MRPLHRNFIALLLCAAVSHLAYAEPSPELNNELNWLSAEGSVEVVSKRKESISSAAGVVSLITKEEIERYNASDLQELLSRVTSIYTAGSHVWQYNVTSMRGDLSTHVNNHILILMNGRPMRDNIFAGLSRSIYHEFPIHFIERVEIVRGPGSVLYGTNAYSGVINIITKKKQANGATFRGRYGSYNTAQAETEFAYQSGKASVSGAMRYKNSDGWLFSAKGEDGRQTQFRNDDDAISGSFSAEWGDFSVNSFLARSQNNHWGAVAAGAGQITEEKKIFVDISYAKEFSPHWRGQWNFTYNYTAHNFPLPNPTPYKTTLYKAHENVLLLEQTQFFDFFDKKLNFLLGGSIEWQTGQAWQVAAPPPLQRATQYKTSLYGEGSYVILPNLKLNAGGQWSRVEYLQGANLDNAPKKVVSDQVGRVGLVYEITPKIGVKLLYSQAFRFAAAAETGTYAPNVLYGNISLQPERIETADAQIFYADKNYQASLTAFRSRQSNLITRALCDSNPICTNQNARVFANSGSAKFEGLEFETKLKPLESLHLQGSYTFQTNHTKTGQIASVAPRQMFKVGASYDVTDDLRLSVFDTYFSKPASISQLNPAVAMYNPEPRSYHNLTVNTQYRLNALLNWNPHKKTTFSIYVDNLLDEKVYYPEFNRHAINSIPGLPGRMLMGEIAIEF
jgi:outer membrane receptor for ferrienterochelin and colicins